MLIIFLTIVTIIFFIIRVVLFNYILRRHPGIIKYVGYYVLTICTGIFIFFPTCIFLGNEVCWDFDVAIHKTVLLVASTIILLLCAWVWYKIITDPRMETSSGKPVATLIVVLAVIVGLIILIFGTSPYWAPLVGY